MTTRSHHETTRQALGRRLLRRQRQAPADQLPEPRGGATRRARRQVHRKKIPGGSQRSQGLTVAARLKPIAAAPLQTNHARTFAARALVAACGSKTPWQVDYADIADASETCAASGVSPFTRYNRLAYLRHFARELELAGAEIGCSQAVQRIPVPRPRPVTFSTAEVQCLIESAPAALRLLILLCHDCCLRSQTAYSLSWNEVSPDLSELVVRTKKGSVQRVPTSKRLRALLQLVPATGPYPQLVNSMRGSHVCLERYRVLWKKLQLRLWPQLTPRRLHDLRRSMAEAMYRASGDVRVAQTMLGHTQLNSTTWYLQRPYEAMIESTAKAQRLVTNEDEAAEHRTQ